MDLEDDVYISTNSCFLLIKQPWCMDVWMV